MKKFRSAVMKKGWQPGDPSPEVKVKRGGPGKSNSGPTGRKMRPAAVRYRALAEMARVGRHRRKKP